MKNKMTLTNFQKIRKMIPSELFRVVSTELSIASEDELEALWSIIVAGYPISFALLNYRNLFDYAKCNNLTYSNTLKIVYTLYPGLNAGILVKYPERFDLN